MAHRVVWMLGQAAVIGGVVYLTTLEPYGREHAGIIISMAVVLTAFFSALAANLWDWARRPAAVRRLLADERKAKRKAERAVAASRRPGELFEQRARGWVRKD